jgi:dTDP-4-dehydrorhamnose reductase
MKVLILGGSGMLGHKLIHSWQQKFEVWATLRQPLARFNRFDFYNSHRTFENIRAEKFDDVSRVLTDIKPDVVVNCIGIIKQLKESKNIISTLELNALFPHRLALACESLGSRLITLSTDCVFKGQKGDYKENDLADATDLYGKSKHLGEVSSEHALTIRTSIIGRELDSAHSLVEWFLSNEGKKIKGFRKAIYTGFPTVVLADILALIIQNKPKLNGLWHISSEPINKFSLLELIRQAFKCNIEIESDDDFIIDRSLNSEKFQKETGFCAPSWEQMIQKMADDSSSIAYPIYS